MLNFEFIDYWMSAGPEKLIRVFWYFFIFELFRYVIMDFIVIILFKFGRYINRTKWQRARESLIEDNPLVSIIVPGKNEGPHIYKLVKSLKEQTYKNFELIVVDDGSDDQTKYIGRDLENNGLIHMFISNPVRGGKASGANAALSYTQGKFVVHLDGDCSFDRDAIESTLIPFYYDPRIAAVGGNLEVRNHHASLATILQSIEYLKVILTGRMVTSYLGIYRIISGAFGTFRTDVIKRLGGWDIGPGLDGDITVKIRKLGYKVHFEPTANGLTSVPDTFSKLIKQRLRWDKSIVRFRLRKHIDVFYPNANFRMINMLSSLENIGYNLIFNVKWFIYIIDILINYGGLIHLIIPMNILFYTISNYLQFLMIQLIAPNPDKKHYLLWFVPLMVLYNGYFLRIVRTMAHFKELFFLRSYDDPWNPLKSSLKAKALRI